MSVVQKFANKIQNRLPNCAAVITDCQTGDQLQKSNSLHMGKLSAYPVDCERTNPLPDIRSIPDSGVRVA